MVSGPGYASFWAFVVAVTIGSLVTKPWVNRMRLKGEVAGQLAEVRSSRAKLIDARLRVEASEGKDRAAHQEMLQYQRDLLIAEEDALTRLLEIAKDPKLAKKAGITEAERGEILGHRVELEADLLRVQASRISQMLEHTGGNDFLVDGELFDVVKDHYAGKAKVTELGRDEVTGARRMSIELPPTSPRPRGTPSETIDITERLSDTAGVVSQAPVPVGQADGPSTPDAPPRTLPRLRRYDPKQRTDAELMLDRDPVPRKGESVAKALRRAAEAQKGWEIRLRAKGQVGADLHNHLLGVAKVDYFILKVGNGDAFRLFERSYQVLVEAGEGVRANAKDSWNVAVEAKNKLAAMRAEGKSEAEQLEMIKDALRKMFQASERTAFDHTYELRDELIKAFIDKGSPHYANFAKDAMRELAKEGIAYSEQSVSIKKLTNKLPEKMVMDARAGLQKEGLDTDMRFLPMVNTRLLGAAARTPQGKAAFDGDIAALRELLKRADSMGVDVAGPEAQEFTPEGMANFRELYDVVHEAALRRKRSLVLRPHVGEGYVPKGEGRATGARVELARKNL